MNQLNYLLNQSIQACRILAIFLLFLTVFNRTWANNYQTIGNGDWKSNSIWSMNGTPCTCIPGNAITGDSVKVSHILTFDNNIQVKSGSYLFIDTLAVMTGLNHRIDVQNGHLRVIGELYTKEVTVDANGEFTNDGFVIISGATFLNAGTATVSGKLSVTGLNMDLQNSIGATLTIGMSGNITVTTGNVVNQGLLIFAPVSCASINGGGDFHNSGVASTVIGVGAVWVGGVLINDGYWDSNVNWCANSTGGAGSLPPKNCTTSCGPLPVIVAGFTASLDENQKVNLNWEVSLEFNNDFYTIERSTDGNNFEYVTKVDATGASQYEATDEFPVTGNVFYRLSQTDLNGSSVQLETQMVSDMKTISVLAFPNPCQSQLNVSMAGFDDGIDLVSICDISGKQVWQCRDIPVSGGKGDLTIVCDMLQPGLYFVSATKGMVSRKVRVIKI